MRALLLSDIHGNLEALEACLAAAPSHDLVVNMGDIVGYGASPKEVIECSQQLGKIFVRGNHDKAVAGLVDMRDFNPQAAMAALWTRNVLNQEHLSWLKTLPQGPTEVEGLPGVQFVHGSPLDEDQYLVTLLEAAEPLLVARVPVTFFGHTHLQGCFIRDGANGTAFRPAYLSLDEPETVNFPLQQGFRYLVNPGSVGQPRDGDWRAAFGLYDTDRQVVTFCRTPYDLQRAQDRILAANLPPRLATRLADGR